MNSFYWSCTVIASVWLIGLFVLMLIKERKKNKDGN